MEFSSRFCSSYFMLLVFWTWSGEEWSEQFKVWSIKPHLLVQWKPRRMCSMLMPVTVMQSNRQTGDRQTDRHVSTWSSCINISLSLSLYVPWRSLWALCVCVFMLPSHVHTYPSSANLTHTTDQTQWHSLLRVCHVPSHSWSSLDVFTLPWSKIWSSSQACNFE